MTKSKRKLGRAKGDMERRRAVFLDPPTHTTGQPFISLRVKRELLDAFARVAKKHPRHGKARQPMNAMLRAYMSKVTGVSEVLDDDEE